MSAATSTNVGRKLVVVSVAAGAVGVFLLANLGQVISVPTAQAQDTKGNRAPAILPLANEPPAKIVIDPPLAGALARGVVIIQFRTESLRIMPVFGPDAARISPRVGHLHVTLDDAPWHWGNTSGEPIILAGLAAGPHKVMIELADPNHQVLDKGVVNFVIPKE